MTKDELIVKQQLEIEQLKQDLDEYREACKKVVMRTVCIGGPLNDNVLQYTRKQMGDFFFIKKTLECLPDLYKDND